MIACRFEVREDPPGSGNGVAWCRTHLCVHDSNASAAVPAGGARHENPAPIPPIVPPDSNP